MPHFTGRGACYVLLIDFWHPSLSLPEREALQSFMELEGEYIRREMQRKGVNQAAGPSLREHASLNPE